MFHDAEMGRVNVSWTDPTKTNGIIIGYSVKYKEMPGSKVQSLEVKGERRWTVIDHLKPAALYQFSVAAKTKAGVGSYRKQKFDFTWRKFWFIFLSFWNLESNFLLRYFTYDPFHIMTLERLTHEEEIFQGYFHTWSYIWYLLEIFFNFFGPKRYFCERVAV